MTKLIRNHLFRLILIFLSCTPYHAASGQDTSSQQVSDINVVGARSKALKAKAAAIEEEKSELALWKKEFNSRTAKLKTSQVKPYDVEQALLEIDDLKVSIESNSLDIVAAEQNRLDIENSIQKLTDQLQNLAADPVSEASNDISRTKAALAEKRSLLELELRYIKQLLLQNSLTREHLSLAEKWWMAIRDTYQRQQEKVQQQSLEHLDKQLNTERGKWQSEIVELKKELAQLRDQPLITQAQRDLTEAQLLKAEESIFLADIRYKLAKAEMQMKNLTVETTAVSKQYRSMKALSDQLNLLKNQIVPLAGLLKSKELLIQQRIEVIQKRKKLDIEHENIYNQIYLMYEELIKDIEIQSSGIASLTQKLSNEIALIDTSYLEQKKQNLTLRHHLPHSMDEWQTLLTELEQLPKTLLQSGRLILVSLHTAMQQAGFNVWSLLAILTLAWSIFCLRLGRLKPSEQFDPTRNFTQKTLYITTSLLRTNRYSFLLSGLLIISAWVLDIIPPGLILISSLVAIWLGARLVIGLSWWILKSPVSLSEKQPGLYHLIVLWVLLVSFFSIILVFAHLGFLSTEMRDLVDRAFMLLLLPPVYLSFHIRKLVMARFREIKGNLYWVRLLGLAGFIIPLAILMAALLGISGYINLAWTVAGYLSIFILVVVVWLIIRGLVIDISKNIEVKLAKKSEHSSFWIRSLVKPVQFIIRIGLFLLAAWILYRLLGGDPTISLQIKNWLTYPIFSIGKLTINSLNLMGTVLSLMLVFYISRWAREVTYGWLYADIRDLGIRNSLSVFTQYAVVVLGILIALNLLGIELTSLTVFAGALGVGIGFGLQNIANNFISGLILLAERPIRTDDWVTIGNNEGTVSQIGMRSVTVTTWDNQDVIIPNSELVSNAFVNWTRTNKIVRTVLIIGIRYQDDPHVAKKVIQEAVMMQPEVILDPEPHVWLTEFAASSVNFRVQYHLDVGEFSRLKIKSEVMFAIWDALKEANIGIPFPQQDIYIKELPTDDS